jgi:L-histidine Nalpha-methyltransferase
MTVESHPLTSLAQVAVHASQFPDRVRMDLLDSLRSRQVNHKFHYDSVKQTQKWLALHQSYSPTRNDSDCVAIYERSFAAAARITAPNVTVIGLGCGGGQKDTRLLARLTANAGRVAYAPCDVAGAMVLVARQAALAVLPPERCFPFIFDFAAAADLPAVFAGHLDPAVARLYTFFGMIPNFEPAVILPRLAALVRPEDWLLFSANLAPGGDYAAGVRQILPQYDNGPTREWLLTFLLDLGVERSDGELRFAIATDPANGLQRVEAVFHFTRNCRIEIEDETFDFPVRSVIRLFFSYRYTPDRVRAVLAAHGLQVHEQWITLSEEEGVFLCRRQ